MCVPMRQPVCQVLAAGKVPFFYNFWERNPDCNMSTKQSIVFPHFRIARSVRHNFYVDRGGVSIFLTDDVLQAASIRGHEAPA